MNQTILNRRDAEFSHRWTQMAELFQTTQQNVSLHIQNTYEEGELKPEATHKESLLVRQEGARSVQRRVEFYNLDVIISVGYRVKSHRGTPSQNRHLIRPAATFSPVEAEKVCVPCVLSQLK